MSNLVDRYQFLSTVAQNQNSRMHRCFDKSFERDVAVKIWNAPGDSVNKSVDLQYSILARINNRFIVKATDSGRTGEGLPYLATEWVAGGSLNESSNSLTIEEIVTVMSQLAEGLDFLHSIGFVHGDIKPGNILTDKNEMGGLCIRLTDFEFLEPGGNLSPHCWKGTPAYMAPEIIRGELVTFHSDLYSFGVLLYHLLTGRLPFQEQDLYALAHAHLDKEPSFEPPEVSNLPPQLVTLVLNLLQKNPAERPDAAWKIRDSLIHDVDSIKRADRLLAHSLIDYSLGEKSGYHLPEENLHRKLNGFFNGLDPERKLCQFLLNKSGGELRIISQVLHGLIETGQIVREKGGWAVKPGLNRFGLPDGIVNKCVSRDLAVLSPDSRRLLEGISIWEYPVQMELMEKLTDLNLPALQANVSELEQAGWVVRSTNDRTASLHFSKGIDRDFVLKNLSPEKVGDFRRQIIELLQKRVEPSKEIEILKELLFQFQATEDRTRIYECARQLSDWACARDHRGDALDYTHLALEHAPWGANGTSVLQLRLAELYNAKGQPSSAAEYYSLYIASKTLTHPEISQVLRKLGLCRARLGDYVSAEELILSAIENWEKERQEGELVRVLLDHSTLKRLQRQYQDCETILQNCSRILHHAQPSEQMVELYKQKGILSWYRGDYQAAQDNLLSGLKMAEELGIETEVGAISNNLGLTFRDWGKPEIALVHLDRALEIASSRGDQVRICSTLNNLALVHLNLKNIDEAVKLAERSYALAQDSFYRLGEALAHNNLAFIYLQAGRTNSALFHAGTAVTEFKRLNDESGLGLALYNLAEIYRLRELKSLARECYHSSLLIRRNLGEKLGMADSLAGLSRLHFEDSDTSPNPGYSEEAIGLYRELNKETEIARLYLARAEALIQDGNAAEASKCIDESDRVTSPAQPAAVRHLGALVQGLRDAEIREYRSAERKLRLALGGFTQEQDLPMRAKSCLYLGNLFREQGMFRAAERFYRESLGMYKELGVMSKVKQLEDRMNELTVLDDKGFEHVQTLSKISHLLAHIEDENLFLENILKLSAELLGAERGAIIIFDEKSSDFEVKVSLHLEEDTTRDALKISKRTVTEVFNTGDTFISEDSLSDPLLTKHLSIRTHNILSIICAPLRYDKKIIGTLYLDNRSLVRAFSQSDRAFITALTNLISVGMSKAQNYGKIIEELYQLKRSSGTLLEFPNIVGITPVMQEIFSMVSKAAPSKATILLLGESGTGKEVIANLIHNLSDRKSRPFIRVNCAALPESLLESELFGIEEKVASGVNFREGKFKQADGGTIFLDEVGDMSLATQSKVLRILQEEEFERVGGNRTIKVDIRVIAATNKDLDKALKENQFRHDLYYRLNTVCVTVPPLRERREDIPLLVSHFIGKFSGENGKPAVKVSAPVMQTLCEFNWPGNVRQLMNVIQRGVIFAEQGVFTLKQLGFGLLESVQEKSKSARISKLKDHLDREEKSLITLALKQCDWNQSKAARLLDLPQSSLARKITKHRIRKPSKI